MKVGVPVLWNAIAICEMSRTPWQKGKHRNGDNLENGPMIPFGAMVECHPISPKDKSRVHQVGKKVLLGNLSWL